MAGEIARRRLLLAAPLGIAAAAGAGFWVLLGRMREGSYDPRGIPSVLVGRKLPEFALPPLSPGLGFSSADVLAAGRPVLINFFASWCVPCQVEAPLLMQLRERGAAIWGIAYKDKSEASADFLRRTGDPYERIARDDAGQVAIDFGVYGVPETYLIDKTGVVRWRWAGPLMQDTIDRQLEPLLQKYA
jgi:cytochrome c biogenesis protein CcmG/thiol:disulfide interchange protein DsbE